MRISAFWKFVALASLCLILPLSGQTPAIAQEGKFRQHAPKGDFDPKPQYLPTDIPKPMAAEQDDDDDLGVPFEEPQTARYYYRLGLKQQSAEKFEKAIESFESALQLKGRETPDTKTSITRFQLYKTIAEAHVALNQLQSAKWNVSSACRQKNVSQKDRFELSFWLAQKFTRASDNTNALKQYKEAFQFCADEKDKVKLEDAVNRLSLSSDQKRLVFEKSEPKLPSLVPSEVEDLLNSMDKDGIHKSVWEMWHKIVAEAIYAKFNKLAKLAKFKNNKKQNVKVAYTVTKNRQITNVRLYQRSGNKIFDMIVLAAIRSMNGSPLLRFPDGSTKESVNKTGIFFWNHQNNNIKMFLDGDSDAILDIVGRYMKSKAGITSE